MSYTPSSHIPDASRVKNIVFDLGNVLISYQPEDFHRALGDSPEAITMYIGEIYNSQEWQLIDKGVMEVEEATRSISARTALSPGEVRRVFDLRQELLFPIESNVSLLPLLKRDSLRLFYITNFPADMFDLLHGRYDFFRHFEGGVVSSAVKLLKPDPMIYRALTEGYGISPLESLFIDDLPGNISAAAEAGFMTLHLPVAEDLEQYLRRLFPAVFARQ